MKFTPSDLIDDAERNEGWTAEERKRVEETLANVESDFGVQNLSWSDKDGLIAYDTNLSSFVPIPRPPSGDRPVLNALKNLHRDLAAIGRELEQRRMKEDQQREQQRRRAGSDGPAR